LVQRVGRGSGKPGGFLTEVLTALGQNIGWELAFLSDLGDLAVPTNGPPHMAAVAGVSADSNIDHSGTFPSHGHLDQVITPRMHTLSDQDYWRLWFYDQLFWLWYRRYRDEHYLDEEELRELVVCEPHNRTECPMLVDEHAYRVF
jgi:hypothetical protein